MERQNESVDSDVAAHEGNGDGGTDDAVAELAALATPSTVVAAMSREQIIARAKDFKAHPTLERVSLPWLGAGTHVYVRGMTSRERDDFESSLVARNAKGERTEEITSENIRAKFLVRTLCGEEGTRLFADHEIDLISSLDAKSADALYDAARSLSGVTKADVEEMQKNSGRAPSGTTSSRSDSKNSNASPTS